MSKETEILEFLGECIYNPLKYVMGAFPWESNPAIQIVPLPEEYRLLYPNNKWGPDRWQCDFLTWLGKQTRKNGFDGRTPVPTIRAATVTGHGTGKSTLSAWLIKWIMDTRPLCKGTVTANTSDQLRSKTWSELGKWHSMSITRDWFRYVNTVQEMRLAHKDRNFKDQWFAEGKTCRPERSEAFAGQHAANSTSFYLFDEASAVPDIFYEIREGGLRSGEPMVFDFGNGTRKTGRFYEECVGRLKENYAVRSIDSRNVYLTNKEAIAEEVAAYGEDSDYIKVRVRGMFPDKGSLQFMSSLDVQAATERMLPPPRSGTPLVFGVDCAGNGPDENIIFPRLGFDLRSYAPRRFRSIKGYALAEEVVRYANEFNDLGIPTTMVFVDETGGYGAEVVNCLQKAGLPVTGICFGEAATDNRHYAYMVDQIWANFRSALPKLALPGRNTPTGEELFTQLTQREYGHTIKGQERLETKEAMRSRGVSSPDLADAATLTFARVIAEEGTVGENAGGVLHFTRMKQDNQSGWR